MKTNLNYFLIAVLSAVMCISSCKKDSNGNSPAEGGLAAKVDGTTFKAEAAGIVATYDGTSIDITAIESSGKILEFSIDATTTGTYDISSASGNSATYQDSLNGDQYDSDFSPTKGKFILTTFDLTAKKMSGSFEFGAYSFSLSGFDSVTVKDGSFNKIAFTTSGGAGNVMSATVDGTPSVCTNVTATENATAIGIEIRGSVTSSAYPKVALIIPSGQPVGTYQLSSTDCDAYYLTSSTGSLISISGSITITAHNTATSHIEGTFAYQAQDINLTGPIYNITAGSFSVDY